MAKTGNPRGRPTNLGQVVDTHDGRPVTACEALVERLRGGAHREEAARSVGISKASLYDWIKRGALARGRAARGETVERTERRFIQFLDAVEEAEAQAQLTDWSRLGTLAAGGVVQVTTREKVEMVTDADGKTTERVIERVTTSDATLPSVAALTWRMERRWPHRFGRRVELTGAGGQPLIPKEDRIDALAAALEGYQAGVDDGAARERDRERDGAETHVDG